MAQGDSPGWRAVRGDEAPPGATKSSFPGFLCRPSRGLRRCVAWRPTAAAVGHFIPPLAGLPRVELRALILALMGRVSWAVVGRPGARSLALGPRTPLWGSQLVEDVKDLCAQS